MTNHDKAVENFYNLHDDEKNNYITGFEEGCEYKSTQLIDKACEWLNKNVVEYHPRTGELRPVVNINAFREAMEMEDE